MATHPRETTPTAVSSLSLPRGKRATTVISIPTSGNRIYGEDVPLFWREAARQTGIPDRSFWSLIERREIAKLMVGRRVMIRPSAIRTFLKTREVAAS